MLAVKFKQTYQLDFAPVKDYISSNFQMKPEELVPVYLAVDNAAKLRVTVCYMKGQALIVSNIGDNQCKRN